MFQFNFAGSMILISALILPSLALSEPVTLGYFARTEAVTIRPADTYFGCADTERPAQIEIDDAAPATTRSLFPVAMLDSPVASQVGIRRGVDLLTEQSGAPLVNITNDWRLTVSGRLDVCAGPATLRVMQGHLDVFAQLGRYEATILGGEDALQDLRVSYETKPADQPLVQFLHQPIPGFPSHMNGQLVGDVPNGGSANVQVVGRIDLDAREMAVRFTHPTTQDDITEPTHLNITLFMLSSGPDFALSPIGN